jgi:methylenetetrahydrofolate reductase (NADPH)
MKLRDAFKSGKFVITAECGPAKGTDMTQFKSDIEVLKDKVDAINITDQQSAVMRVGSLAGCIMLMEKGIQPIMQMTCRDRNRIALRSDLLAAAAFGIESVLTLTGDGVEAGDQPDAKPVFDLDSTTLLETIRDMSRDSTVMEPRERTHAPVFFRGAADAPFFFDNDWKPQGLMAKADVGAQFVQSQYCFDMELLERYMQRLADHGVTERLYFLVGLGPLKSAKVARWMRDTLFGTIIPDGIIRRMEAARDPRHEGIAICAEMIQQAREIRGIAGVHLMAPGQHREIVEAIRLAGLS